MPASSLPTLARSRSGATVAREPGRFTLNLDCRQARAFIGGPNKRGAACPPVFLSLLVAAVVLKQLAHRIVFVNAADCVGKQRRHGEHLDLWAVLLRRERDGIRHHQRAQW